MYEERNGIDTPPRNTTLWRYMDFTKFASLLKEHALFFVRVDKLGDPFEGAFPDINVRVGPLHYGEDAPKIHGSLLPHLQGMRRFTAISCWHESDYESEAMWQRYSRENDGVAIRTSFGDLIESMKTPKRIYAGRVTYIDYARDLVPENDPLLINFYKRKAFEHEKEVRAVRYELPSIQDQRNPSKRVINTSITPFWDPGLYIPVDLATLVNEIIVAPLAPEWFLDLTQSIAETYGLHKDVRKSTLADTPRWNVDRQADVR